MSATRYVVERTGARKRQVLPGTAIGHPPDHRPPARYGWVETTEILHVGDDEAAATRAFYASANDGQIVLAKIQIDAHGRELARDVLDTKGPS